MTGLGNVGWRTNVTVPSSGGPPVRTTRTLMTSESPKFDTSRAVSERSFSSAGAMPMTRLGSLLQVHPTSVTSAVDRLERQGFVERQRQDDDRRVVLAAITDAGRAVVEKATDGLNSEVFERPGLSARQLDDLTGLLGVLRKDAGDTVD